MLVIRLFRVGKKNQPAFKIVVTDKKNPPRGGRFVEQVGFYNPLTKKKVLKAERIKYWISVGAQPSATVYNLLIKEKVLEGGKIPSHKKSKKKKEKPEVPTTELKKPVPEPTGEKPTEELLVIEKPVEEAQKEEKLIPEKLAKKEPEEKIEETAKEEVKDVPGKEDSAKELETEKESL